jgi:ATP-binding cassette, subfamily B, bacterial MsbA
MLCPPGPAWCSPISRPLAHPVRLLRRVLRRSLAPLLAPLLDPRPASALIRETARRQWRRIGTNLLMSLVQALAEGATLGVVFLAVDLLGQAQRGRIDWTTKPVISMIPGLSEGLAAQPVGTLFIGLLATAVLLKLIQSLAMYAGSVVMGYYSASCTAEITARIHGQILSFTFPCASRYPVGDLTNYSGGGAGAVMTEINTASGFLVNLMMVATYLAVLVALSPWLLLAAAAMGGLLTAVQGQLLPRIRRRGFRGTDIGVAISTRITEDIQGLRLLHSSGQLDAADQGLRSRMGELEENTRAQTLLGAVVGPITVFLPIALIALIAGLSLAVFGTRSSGVLPSLVTFVVALQRMNGGFGALAGNFTTLNGNAAALERLNTILDTSDKQFRRRGGRPFDRLRQAIQLKGVGLTYAPELPPALRGIELTIPLGTTVALVGASGAGKSSIADLLVGLYEPSEGRILIDNRDLEEFDLASWQQRLGVVSQDTFLFNATLAYNIAFGTSDVSREQIEAAAAKAQAHGFISDLPDGYDTLVGERGYRLSGGQRQRISLARAILRDPDLMILDEATSALDSQSERLVQQAIEQFEGRHTVLVIAHRLSTIVNADLICVMEAGRIVERGSHRELLARQGLYAGLWRQQASHGLALAEA